MDSSWHIDVKKSTAFPPHNVRKWLENYAKDVRKIARQVFAHRGSYHRMPANKEILRIWNPTTRGGNHVYRIDRSHPLVDRLTSAHPKLRRDISTLLRVLEETVPIEKIWLDMAEHPEKSNEPLGGMSEREVLELASHMVAILSGPNRRPSAQSIELVCRMDGFSQYRHLISAHFSSGESELD
jgi:hypothetical protein